MTYTIGNSSEVHNYPETDKMLEELSEYPMLMSTSDFAQFTGYSRATAYRLIEQGDLDAKYITISKGKKKSLRIPRDSMAKLMISWLNNQTV